MSEHLPLSCRLLGHDWKPSKIWHPTQTAAWTRKSCNRCVRIDIDPPPAEAHPEYRPRP